MSEYECNPERSIDMIDNALQKFNRNGDVLLPDQRAIYTNLGNFLKNKEVLEAGCGLGFGANIMKNQGSYGS